MCSRVKKKPIYFLDRVSPKHSSNNKKVTSSYTHSFTPPTYNQPSYAQATCTSESKIIPDSGCTDILLKQSSAHLLHNRTAGDNLSVIVANNQSIQSTEKGELIIPTKTGNIQLTGHVFRDTDLSNNLAGLSNLCNEGCTVTLDSESIAVTRDHEVIWSGIKNRHDKLWQLDLADMTKTSAYTIGAKVSDHGSMPTQQPAMACQIMRCSNDAEYVQYIHAMLASCPISTLLHAMNAGWLRNIPKLSAAMIRQNLPVSRATAMGYLDQHRQNHRSTKTKQRKGRLPAQATPSAAAAHAAMEDQMHTIDEAADPHLCFQVLSATDFLNSSDATGKFPLTTLSGWNYLLVSTMGGYMHFELLRDRTAPEYRRAYKAMYAFYTNLSKTPTRQRLDNESSNILEEFLKEVKVKIEFVPPANHRANPSERAIRHAKNGIIAMCHTADPQFPANVLFEEVVGQAEIVLNQLRPWHDDPTINAWTGMHNAPYDHSAHPMSIFGMRVVAYENSQQRPSWGAHGKDGFYLGPALQHYRCWRIHITETNSTRISDTIAWLPEPYRMPGHSPLEGLTAAVTDLLAAVHAITDSDKALLHSHVAGNPATGKTLSHAVQLLRDLYTIPVQGHTDVPPGFAPRSEHADTPTPASTASAPIQLAIPAPTRVTLEDAAPPDRATREPEPTTAPVQRVTPLAPVQPPAPAVPVERVPSTFPPPFTPDAPQYDWGPVQNKTVKKAERRYLLKIDRLFKDDQGPQCIVGIERNHANATGPGSRTLFYKYYNVIDFIAPPTNHNDYDHIPCAELLADRKIQWTSATAQAFAMAVTLGGGASSDVMNLNIDGSPLTHASALAGPNQVEWRRADDTEHRKLVTQTQTIHVIHKADIPSERRKDVAYYNPQVKEKYKEGEWVRRVRGTVGGDRINYKGPVTARTAAMEVVRAMFNSALADDANIMAADITDYYLGTPLLRPEYMRMQRKQVSAEIIEEYGYEKYFVDDMLYFQINKGMYGLPQAGLLAQQRLVAHIAQHGYTQSDTVPCLFRHATNGVTFVLVVDDFGIKYTNTEGRDHLLATLRLLYKITVDMDTTTANTTVISYLGMTVTHDRTNETITCSMPGYIDKVLTRFREWAGTRKVQSPGIYNVPQYGTRVQYATEDDTEPLSKRDVKTLQEIVGSVLYYARAVDPTMLTATNHIASQQALPTQAVRAQAERLLQYAAAYPNNAIVYKKSKMHVILQVDASYLSRSHARSVAGGISYFGDANNPTVENGMIHAVSSIIDVVVASAGEAEYGAAFIYAQHGEGLRNIAIALGHPQPATPILCDNEFAIGLATDTIKMRKSKSIDMRFHWLRDRIRQGHFTITHLAGQLILADFFTKTLSVANHQTMMPRLVYTPPAALHANGRWHVVQRRQQRRQRHPQRAN